MMTTAHTRTAWIVDDSALEAEHAGRTLAAEFRCELFLDGTALLEAVAVRRVPDVVVLDWHMPGLSGIEVIHFLRAAEATADLPVVLLTGEQQTEDVVHGLGSGANDYVVKPYAAAELLARVSAAVRTRELRRRAERAEATVGALLEQLPDALIATDAEGAIRYVNTQAEAVVQRDRRSLVGQPLASLLPGFSPALADGESPAGADLTIAERTFAPAVRRMVLAGGESGFAVTLRDVTEKRRLEHRRLDFYSIIAHDLRSPLNTILMRSELMQRGRRGAVTPEMVAELRKMSERVEDLVELIDDFLDLARLEGTGLKMDPAPFDLVALMGDVLDDFRPNAETGGLSLRFVKEGGVMILADRRRMRQVLTNLMANAIKFSSPGGQVDVALRAAPDSVEISVSDTGRGIDPDALPALFQRYQRAHSANEVSGTGLGLLIVREIVEAHGGTVGARSELGRGSTFWFRLPRPEARVSP